MSDVLRSTTFQLAFNGADGLTGVRTFTKAIRDADTVVGELNKQLGENAQVTYKTVKTKAELERQARAVINQLERNQKTVDKLTQHYQNMAAQIGKTADELEQLNAIQALGSTATEAQKQQVLQAVQQYQALRQNVEGAQGSMRNFRGVMQNVGWQVQDTVVQLQMGTSAFMVLSQQGSQLAAAFGPSGAIIGAGIALLGAAFGALYTSMGQAGSEMERLDKINQEYSKYITVSAEGTTELGAKLEKLAVFSKQAADEQLKLSRLKALEEQKTSVKVLKETLNNFDSDIWEGVYGSETKLGLSSRQLAKLRGSIEGLRFGVNESSVQKFLDALSAIDPTAKGADKGAAALKQTLLEQYSTLAGGLQLLDDTEDGWQSLSKSTLDANKDITKAFESEYKSLVKQTESILEEYDRRKKAIDDYAKSDKGKDDKRNAEAYIALEKWKTQELQKEAKKRADEDPVLKAFNTQYTALIKQTEDTNQEYERRKKIIDDYVDHVGGADEKARKSYADLEKWKTTELDKEFQRFYSQIVKKTESTEEGYQRQKAIIDAHVARVGSVDTKAAEAYAALEQWKTDEFTKEYDKRERVRQRIENAQLQVRGKTDPFGAEKTLFERNKKDLIDQYNSLGEEQLDERTRINALLESEQVRHNAVMAQLELDSYSTQLATYSMAAQQMSLIADLMSTGAMDVKNRVKEMNDFQKTMFLVSQAIAAATAFVNGISLGTKLAELFPLAAPEMIALGTGIGAASAGAITGVTIAGAFDKGGDVPAGQFGIVSEYGDELVNGMLVKGPARVTSREDTARMLDRSGQTRVSLKVDIENRIPSANFQVEQIDENRVRVIAEQVFNRNIDSGVSSTLDNRNSKAAKSLRKNYRTPSRL